MHRVSRFVKGSVPRELEQFLQVISDLGLLLFIYGRKVFGIPQNFLRLTRANRFVCVHGFIRFVTMRWES